MRASVAHRPPHRACFAGHLSQMLTFCTILIFTDCMLGFSYILQHPVSEMSTKYLHIYLPHIYLHTYLPKASTDCPFTDLMGRSVTIANNNPGPLCHTLTNGSGTS